jgi:predicted RNA polymerase sigma factor
MLRKLARTDEAREALQRALALAMQPAERRLMEARLAAITPMRH